MNGGKPIRELLKLCWIIFYPEWINNIFIKYLFHGKCKLSTYYINKFIIKSKYFLIPINLNIFLFFSKSPEDLLKQVKDRVQGNELNKDCSFGLFLRLIGKGIFILITQFFYLKI